MNRDRALLARLESALVWCAAFSFACGFYLSLTLLLKYLPPTAPVAVGIVTILKISKLEDYVALTLFLVLVPPLTLWFRALGLRELAKQQRAFAWRRPVERAESLKIVVALLFTLPFFLSPIFYLTTGKFGWILILPVALAYLGPQVLRLADQKQWLREFGARELHPYHALLFAEAVSWILWRYITVGRRIAHFDTLFLEIVFVALFLTLFWAVAILTCRLALLLFGREPREVFRRITTAALPMVALPFVGVALVPTPNPRLITLIVLLVCALLAMRVRPLSPGAAWKLAGLLVLPALVYLFSFTTTSHPAQWVDLFHRGESLGPAADYLRGKVPYRDVFVLHGMLEDGLLDAWLMSLFGHSLDVAIARTVVLGAFLGLSLWYLGIALFRSIPLALLVVAMGAWTTAENNRTFFQVAAVALFWSGLRNRSRMPLIASGIVAAIALFFSYEIGLYTILGAVIVCALLFVAQRRVTWSGMTPLPAFGWFALGLALGASPFVTYLASRGGLGEFVTQSFVTIPSIIDAVWSLPFPDLVTTFRKNVELGTIADFFVREKFHLIVSPLTIAIASVYVLQRWWRRAMTEFDFALFVVTVFAAAAQRTAFGRAEFRHQYFAAFLIGPMLVMLAILLVRAIRSAWREGDGGSRAFLGGFAVMLIPVVAVLFWIPDLVNARINDLTNYQRRVTGQVHDGHEDEVNWRVEAIRDEVARLTKRGAPIFDFSNQPALYYFSNRPNPTRFYQMPVASPARYQAEIIRDLERAKPNVVLRGSPEGFDRFDGVPNTLRTAAVAAYIDDCYRYSRTVRGVELWTRVKDARPKPVASYLRLVRIPKEDELVGAQPERLVFPAVGSLGGVGGSYWVSELTLHNPSRETLRLSLRYVAGDIRLDRRVTLASRQTLRLPDVVKTLFHAPDSVGVVWIEYPSGRLPLAVVKTVDVNGRGQASVEMPLTGSDAATAGADIGELTIVGLPAATEGRRINVGMVNTGNIPATFRISARTRTGQLLGREIESGVPESEIWLVPNLENVMGATFDENTIIRITPVAGTGVAFASVVDIAGANEFIAAVPTQVQQDEKR